MTSVCFCFGMMNLILHCTFFVWTALFVQVSTQRRATFSPPAWSYVWPVRQQFPSVRLGSKSSTFHFLNRRFITAWTKKHHKLIIEWIVYSLISCSCSDFYPSEPGLHSLVSMGIKCDSVWQNEDSRPILRISVFPTTGKSISLPF